MSVDTDLNLATYYRNTFYLFNNKKSTLDISSTDPQLTDALIGKPLVQLGSGL